MKAVKTTVVKTTFLGRAAVVTTCHMDKSRTGLRVVEVQFPDTGMTDVSLIKGNAMRGTLQIFAEGRF